MMRELLNWRVWTIICLVALAMLAIFALPETGSGVRTWLLLFLASKALGIGALSLAMFLYRRWSGQGRLEGGENKQKEDR